MKALLYGGEKTITYEDVPDATVTDPRNAVVRVTTSSICGSDLHPYHVDTGRRGYVIGHEAVGVVEEVGSDVTRFAVGDRVTVIPSLSCGECVACTADLSMQCRSFPYVRVFGQGMPGIGGCQAEAVEVPSADVNLVKLPEHHSDRIGIALSDSLSTGWFGARNAEVRPGKTAAVIGLGAVGLQATLSALAQGAEQVYAFDLVAERRAVAESYGAMTFPDNPVERVLEATGGEGIDSVVDASGGPATAEIAVALAAKGGNVSVIGVPEDLAMPFPAAFALGKNLTVRFGSCSVQDQQAGIQEAIDTGRLPLEKIEAIVSHELPLARGAEGYTLFDGRGPGVRKVVFVG